MPFMIVGNGHSLSISHQGSICLSKSPHSLVTLFDVSCVPALRMNLLLIHKFTSDTNFIFLLNSSGFVIKVKQIGQILFSSHSNSSIYQLTPPIIVTYLSAYVSFDVLHCHLGY